MITEDGSFIIKNAVEKDSGIYTCLAANNAGTDRQTSKLTYIGKCIKFKYVSEQCFLNVLYKYMQKTRPCFFTKG